MIHVKDLERYGEHGWYFTIVHEDGTESRHRTNGNGEGLWFIPTLSPENPPHQTLGTSQFCVPREKPQATRYIQNYWQKKL